jgi:E3 ubiquitin-protein ligase BOI-like protein
MHVGNPLCTPQISLNLLSPSVSLTIAKQAERIKEALEEATLVRTRSLALTIEESVSKRLKAKDGELELASLKSAQLEGRLKQLTLEVQLWRNVAKNNELMAMNLRQSLEQVMVQARNQQQKNHHHQQYHQHHQHHHQWNAATREEGCGESSEVDDAECFRIVGNLHADELQMTTRKCKVCKGNEVCMLLLPCRHLCLCRDCEREMDACPSCGTTKNASVQVYMS